VSIKDGIKHDAEPVDQEELLRQLQVLQRDLGTLQAAALRGRDGDSLKAIRQQLRRDEALERLQDQQWAQLQMAAGDENLPEPENANDMKIVRTEWIVTGWLELGVVGILAAKYAAGKSFLVLDWACCAASERRWQGQRTTKANVLYIAGEGGVAQAKRFKAWKQEHQEIDDDAIIFLRGAVNVANEAARVYLAGLIRKYNITLVIIDTLAKCAGLADEASATEMRPFINACYQLRDAREECGTTVLIIHHFGKDPRKGARGTSALPSDTDVNLEMWRDDAGRITLHADKLKDAELPKDIGLKLRTVHLEERWGTETSCVIESGAQAVLKPVKEDKDAPVLKHLANNPGTSVLAAATALGQDEENTRKQLKRLKDEGKVDTRPVPGSRARGWFIAADR
jgi:hypothetical protein